MSASSARSARNALRETVASMSDRQLALAASAIGVSLATLTAFAEGRSTLPDHCLQKLAERTFAGRYFVKQREEMRP